MVASVSARENNERFSPIATMLDAAMASLTSGFARGRARAARRDA
jgi:hypothetical protein